ncbi:MAG TPA: hypothetical protein VGQ20_04400 [Acidimicrobiales bacterium]|nr:hypothetical protein [Acidimicrobiales bacterium]
MTAAGKHEFLSPGWIAAVTAIRDEYADRVPPPPVVVRANVIITDAPFDRVEVRGFIDTSHGLAIEPGHLDAPDFTASLDYDTAKALFVEQDPQAVLTAFFGGKIRLTGDASKLLAMPFSVTGEDSAAVDLAREIADRVRAVTA